MSELCLAPGDKYDKQCGEVFLTLNGCIIFHCTLCEDKFKGIHGYASHIIEKHYEPIVLHNEDECDSMNSSNYSDLDVEEQLFEEQHPALEEEEITIAEVIEKKASTKLMTVVPVLDEIDNSIIMKWEEIETVKEKKSTPPPEIKPQKLQEKPLSETKKIHLANEEALLKNNGKHVYKQPLARNKIPDSERKHRCNFCGFAFKDRSNLTAHMKRHTKKMEYQCSYCPKMFFTRTELDYHAIRHTDERPFKCDHQNCSKSFYLKQELQMHIKRHNQQRDYPCEICNRKFITSTTLKRHMTTHTKERNHICLVCNGRFSRRRALRTHMKLHENKREYKCELCEASFNQRAGLSSHMKSKHKT